MLVGKHMNKSIYLYVMFRNYLLSAFRYFIRKKGFALLNIIGLSLGIACSVLIILYVYDELSYDNYHEKADRTYLVCRDSNNEHGESKSGWTTPPMLPVMMETYPEIETGTRLCLWYTEHIFTYEDKTFAEKFVIGADSTVFDVFDIPFIHGIPEGALSRPNTIVLTESTAKKYFGETNPIGKVLKRSGQVDYEITGVVKDQPHNTHFYFDMMFSLFTHEQARVNDEGWFNHTYSSYLVLQEGFDPSDLEAKFDRFVRDHIGPVMEAGSGVTIDWYEEQGYWYRFWLLPLKDVYLSQMINEDHNTKSFVYVLGLIGLFILLLACINYMNLSTAMSINRSHEVGIRKVAGAFRSQLVVQYLGESILLSFIALCLGMLLVELAIPFYNDLTGKALNLDYFSNPLIIPGLLVFAILIGIISGLYPAIALSAFRPVVVLKGLILTRRGTSKSWFRNILVIFQFTICTVIIIGTLIVFKQLGYAQNKYLGFDKEQVLVINRAYGLRENYKLFKDELLKHPAIRSVAYGYNMPGIHHNQQGHHIKGRPDHDRPAMFVAWGDYDYIKTLGLEIVSGRNFNPEMPTDSFTAIVNEEMVRFCELKDPLGTQFDDTPWPAVDSINYRIIGVVKDFHYYSLHSKIEPWILYPLRDDMWWYAFHVMIKFNTEEVHSIVELAEQNWQKFSERFPFEYTFLDENFKRQYDKDIKAKRMFTIFSVFAIVIACLGLLGLASFATNQRTKEVSIRKAMGSDNRSVILLFTKQFSKWVLISTIIAWPIAWYFMQKWLNNFAFRIKMPWHFFILAGLMTLAIALLTVIYHAWTASRKNPVDALRYE